MNVVYDLMTRFIFGTLMSGSSRSDFPILLFRLVTNLQPHCLYVTVVRDDTVDFLSPNISDVIPT